MRTRRNLITLLGGAAAAGPIAASPQQGEPMRSIGVLTADAEDDPVVYPRALDTGWLQATGGLAATPEWC